MPVPAGGRHRRRVALPVRRHADAPLTAKEPLALFEITSHGFRNLSPDPVSFGAGVTLVTGENAQGKTNLLEAVALLCGQRSFRGAAPGRDGAGRERFAVEGAVSGRRVGTERICGDLVARRGPRLLAPGKAGRLPRDLGARAGRLSRAGAPGARRRLPGRPPALPRPARPRASPAAGDDLARYARRCASATRFWPAGGAAGRPGRTTSSRPGPRSSPWRARPCGGTGARRSRSGSSSSASSPRGAGGDYAEIRGRLRGRRGLGRRDPRGLRRALAARAAAGPLARGAAPRRPAPGPGAAAALRGGVVRERSPGRWRWLSLAEWQAVATAAGEPPLFGADDFDAGLSQAVGRGVPRGPARAARRCS